MTLISLLIALALERAGFNRYHHYFNDACERYFGYWLPKADEGHLPAVSVLGYLLLPALVLLALLSFLDLALLELIVGVLALIVTLGCPDLRDDYKGYLQSSSRGDAEGSFIYAERMGYSNESNWSFGQHLMWLNYRHYAAVILWFAVFGAAGALFYGTGKALQRRCEGSQLDASVAQVMEWLDWLPSRLTSLGLLVVGHFSNALSVWLSRAGNPTEIAQRVVLDVASAAEIIEPERIDCNTEPCAMVALAKRNILFLMVVIALLSLLGWLS